LNSQGKPCSLIFSCQEKIEPEFFQSSTYSFFTKNTMDMINNNNINNPNNNPNNPNNNPNNQGRRQGQNPRLPNHRNIRNMDLRLMPCTVVKASEIEGEEEELEERHFGDIQLAYMWAIENSQQNHPHNAWEPLPLNTIEESFNRNIAREGWDWGLIIQLNDELHLTYTLFLEPQRLNDQPHR
jgi:hypothetical protein